MKENIEDEKINNININSLEENEENRIQNNFPLKNIEAEEDNLYDIGNLNINEIKEEFNKNIDNQEEVKENKEIIPGLEENSINAVEKKPIENKENIIENEEPKINNINIIDEGLKDNNINNLEEKNENIININITNNKEEELNNNIILEEEPKINNNKIEEEAIDNNSPENIKNINKEEKENDDLLGFLNFDKNDYIKQMKQGNEKEEQAKRDGDDANAKKNAKLNEVFLNSFTLQSKSENKEKKEKEDKKTYNNFIIVENEIHYNEEMFNDQNQQEKHKRYQDIFKFKEQLDLKKKLKKFYLFYSQCKTGDDKSIYKLGKALVYTYRKNFPKITNYKNKKTFTTDAWWGCMVRCGQMILSRAIYRLLKSKGLDTKMALYYTVPLFGNYPIREYNLHPYFQGMINKYKELTNLKESPDNEIKEFYPPFAIRTLCDVGELYERTAGEWFSDVIITGVFRRISEYYDLFTHKELTVKIMTFQSCIEMKDILETCFVKKKFVKNNNQYIHYNGNYYYFDKLGIIFINVRVGLDKIPKDYYPGIKKLFTLKECIGIIGGKTRLAYYFIGYNEEDDALLYLDPHVTKEADKVINMGNILSKHVNKEIHLLKMSKMSTAFTIGFCFRNYDEFLDMYEFWQKAKNDKLPILGIIKQSIEYNEKDIFDENEDFSPTYEDKDEDDF